MPLAWRSIQSSLVFVAVALAGMQILSAQQSSLFRESYNFSDNNRIGKRLTVSFPNAPTDAGKSTEITLFQESYYDVSLGHYANREVAIITGMGLGTSGLKLVLSDARQLDVLSNCLEKFEQTNENFRAYKDVIETKQEEWMNNPSTAIGAGRPLGDVYFYPSKKDLKAEFNWDFELNRVWLSFGSRIMIDQRVIPYIRHMIGHLDRYKQTLVDYQKTIETKNREIDDLLGIDR